MSNISTEDFLRVIDNTTDTLYALAGVIEFLGYQGLADHLYDLGNETNIEHDRLLKLHGPFVKEK